MKIVRKIEGLGRMVVPKAIREHMGIGSGDSLEFTIMENGQVTIKKFAEVCVFCGEKSNLTKFGESFICQNCIDNMKSTLKSTAEKEAEEEELLKNGKVIAEIEKEAEAE